jgi:hypothetical protein
MEDVVDVRGGIQLPEYSARSSNIPLGNTLVPKDLSSPSSFTCTTFTLKLGVLVMRLTMD